MSRISEAELESILLQNPILQRALTPEAIQGLCQYLTIEEIPSGDRIIEVGSPAVELKILLEGEAGVSLDGAEVEVLGPHDIFGEAMFSDEGIRTADVIAKTDCVVAALNLWAYESMLYNQPEAAIIIKESFEKLYEERQSLNEQRRLKDESGYLVLIAHDAMKKSLARFVKSNQTLIESFPLVATGKTGVELHNSTGVVLSRKVKSGYLGGYQEIGAMISEGDVMAVFFFRDPLSDRPQYADIHELGRLCDVYQVPFASNPATALAILAGLKA